MDVHSRQEVQERCHPEISSIRVTSAPKRSIHAPRFGALHPILDPQMRVLLVDDSAVARVTVARRLRAEGHEVVEYDSRAAARAADATTFACALLDFDLGDGYGVDVAKDLRARADIPIAFFTSEKRSDIETQTAIYGPTFSKPSEIDAAIAWVVSH